VAAIISNILKRILFLAFLIILFSCEEQGIFISCDDCLTDEPVTTELEIHLNGDVYQSAVINIYEGNLEDSILIHTVEFSSSKYTRGVGINRKYTVTATYQISGKIYIAVDSATPRVKYSKEQCDNPCYWVYDRILDVELKLK